MSDAIIGGRGAYVPCLEEPAAFPPDPPGAIVGTAVGFVARTAEPAAFPGPSVGAVVGGAVGFVAGPCEEEQDLEPCGPDFPNGPELQAVWQNLLPGASPLNTTAGTVTLDVGGVALPPGFVSPGDYSYVRFDSQHSVDLITLQPILRFTVDPGAILFEFLKNGSLLSAVIADIVPVGSGPDYYFAIADPNFAPDYLCLATGDELAIWASGDLSQLTEVSQGRIRLQSYT